MTSRFRVDPNSQISIVKPKGVFRGVFLVSQGGFGRVFNFPLGFLRNIVEKFMYITYSKDYKGKKLCNTQKLQYWKLLYSACRRFIFWQNFMKIHHFEEHSHCLGVVWGIFPHGGP